MGMVRTFLLYDDFFRIGGTLINYHDAQCSPLRAGDAQCFNGYATGKMPLLINGYTADEMFFAATKSDAVLQPPFWRSNLLVLRAHWTLGIF